jgi:hypothetical protein
MAEEKAIIEASVWTRWWWRWQGIEEQVRGPEDNNGRWRREMVALKRYR